jgi:hypothetical protein
MNLREIPNGDATPLNVPGNEDGRYCVANGWTTPNFERAKLAYETFARRYYGASWESTHGEWEDRDYHEQCAWRDSANAIVRDVSPLKYRD